jgi:hypothetical protein
MNNNFINVISIFNCHPRTLIRHPRTLIRHPRTLIRHPRAGGDLVRVAFLQDPRLRGDDGRGGDDKRDRNDERGGEDCPKAKSAFFLALF